MNGFFLRLTALVVVCVSFLPSHVSAQSLQERLDELERIYEERQYHDFLERVEPLLQQVRDAGDREVELDLEDWRGDAFLRLGRYGEAVESLQPAWDRLGGMQQGYRIGNLLATAYRYQGYYDRSLALYMEILDRVREHEDRRTLAGVQQNLAVVYMHLGDVEAALERYANSLGIMEDLGDDEMRTVILNNIGELYREEDELETALDYLTRSHDLAVEIESISDQSRALLNMGLVHRALGEPWTALEQFDRSLELAEQEGNVSRPIQILYNRGMTYLDMGEFEPARAAFEESMARSRRQGIVQGLYYNRVGFGRLHRELGEYDRAMEYFGDAEELAIGSGSLRMQLTPLRGLWETALDAGSESTALQHLVRYNELSDSVRSRERDEALSRYQVLLNIQDQQRRNELLESRLASQRLTLWLVAVSGILLLALVVGLYVIFRRQRRMSRLLQSRSSELARLNRQLSDQKQRLDELNATKDRLISVLAHDLRTPVAQLQGVAMLIRDGDLDDTDREELFGQVDRELSRSVSMLQDYLDWARSQMDGLNPDMQPVDLQELVGEVTDRMSPNAEEKSISLQNRLQESVTVNADRQMTQVILQNLVSNAIKFSNSGADVVVLTEPVEDGEQHRARLVVRDNGVGIPPELEEQIFQDPGSRRSGTDDEKGTGLGLIICREFAEKQGFDLNFRTGPEGGMDFYLEMELTPVVVQK